MSTLTSKQAKIAIVTQDLDPHAEAVMDHLNCWGLECLRLHPHSLIDDWQFGINIDEFDESYIGVLSSARGAKFSELRSVYYRKPEPPTVTGTGNISVDQFRLEEACGARDALFQLFETKWFNNPYVTRRNGHKLYQLRVAQRLGLQTPRTVMTNQLEMAIDFIRREPGQHAVIKPLGGISAVVDGRVRQCNCRRVTLADLELMKDSVVVSPFILQQYLKKRRDIRVTIIEQKVIACAIYSQDTPEGTVDWRNVSADRLRHQIIELPTPLVEKLLQLHSCFDVHFGAIDLVEDPDGQYWFLEDNLNGQWLWIEHMTGYPLAQTMASALAGLAL